MKVGELIGYVKEVKPSTFDDNMLMNWLNDISAQVQVEIFDKKAEGVRTYELPDDYDQELELPKPYDQVFTLYVEAQIDFALQEIGDYNNTMALFNAAYKDAQDYYARNSDSEVHITALL